LHWGGGLLLIALYLLSYNLTHASTTITLNINNGQLTLEVPKGTETMFKLTTTTTSTSELGYTLSAFSRSSNNDITINACDSIGIIWDSVPGSPELYPDGIVGEYCDGEEPLSSDANNPTAIEVTDFATGEKITTTGYTVNVGAGIADGTYNITIAYHLAENKPNYLANVITNNNITTMQNLTNTLCNSADYDNTNNGNNDNNTATLTDTRNNQSYRVRKMPDNNCWMIDNLKFAYGTQGTDSSYSYDDPYYFDPLDPNLTYYNDAITDPTYCATGVFTQNPASTTGCGYLYNWPAATAGTGTSAITSGNATGSICPTNFRLPTGGNTGDSTNEFDQLNAKMAGFTNNQDTSYQNDPYSYYASWQPSGAWQGVFSGYWNGGLLGQGGGGVFWSATANGANLAHGLNFVSGFVYPVDGGNKDYGLTVRCLVS
jgi:uncharacterized protein (TIGR02145 family)